MIIVKCRKDFNNMLVCESTINIYKDYKIILYRIKNDINGNPRYKLILYKNDINITEKVKDFAGIYYKKNNYCIIKSYNIKEKIRYIFDKLESNI